MILYMNYMMSEIPHTPSAPTFFIFSAMTGCYHYNTNFNLKERSLRKSTFRFSKKQTEVKILKSIFSKGRLNHKKVFKRSEHGKQTENSIHSFIEVLRV